MIYWWQKGIYFVCARQVNEVSLWKSTLSVWSFPWWFNPQDIQTHHSLHTHTWTDFLLDDGRFKGWRWGQHHLLHSYWLVLYLQLIPYPHSWSSGFKASKNFFMGESHKNMPRWHFTPGSTEKDYLLTIVYKL